MTTEHGLDIVVDTERAEAALWRRARFEDDALSRGKLFDRYTMLARAVAARHWRSRRRASDRSDIEQFAYEGLLQALDRFDPLRGIPFVAFARRRITGSIANGMARMTDLDAEFSCHHRIRRERLRTLAASGPTQSDPVAALADLVVDLAVGLMLEGTGLVDGIDSRPSPYEGLAWRQAQAALTTEIASLPDTQALVIRQHYQTGLSFAHIADLLRLSRGRISQLHRAAIEKLRRRLRSHSGT